MVVRDTLQTKPLYVRPDGTGLLVLDKNINLESCLFPFMFPFGTGSYKEHQKQFTYVNYIKFRMKALFSPWTLVKPYLLLSYQIRHVII